MAGLPPWNNGCDASSLTTPVDSPVTVEQALAIPELQRGDPLVQAGESHLDRPIRWVHAAEVRHVARLLRGDELLLTTGIGLGSRLAEHRRFVERVAEKNVAGVIIELGHVFDTISATLTTTADKAGLPLVVLRREVSFVDVSEAILREILDRQYMHLQRGTEAHNELSQIVLNGGGVIDVVRSLAAILRNPVLLENGEHEILGHAEFRTPIAEALGAWRTMGGPGSARGAGHALVVPLPTNGTDGRLVILPLDGTIGEQDRAVAERAALLLALVMLQTDQKRELGFQTRGDFLGNLANGNLTSEEAASEARSLGFQPANEDRLVPVAARITQDDSLGLAPRLAEIAADLRNDLAERKLEALIGLKAGAGELLLLVALSTEMERTRIAAQIADSIREFVAQRNPGARSVIAVGGETGWDRAASSLHETAETAEAAGSMGPKPWHDALEPVVDRLVWQLRDSDALRHFIERQIGALLEHDSRKKIKLMPTLESLCRQGGNKAEAARELFLARQALYNRLNRINKILGYDVTEPENFQAANLAVIAARQIGATVEP